MLALSDYYVFIFNSRYIHKEVTPMVCRFCNIKKECYYYHYAYYKYMTCSQTTNQLKELSQIIFLFQCLTHHVDCDVIHYILNMYVKLQIPLCLDAQNLKKTPNRK